MGGSGYFMIERDPNLMDRVNASVASILRNEGNFSDAQKLFPLSQEALELYYPNSRSEITKLFPRKPQVDADIDFLLDEETVGLPASEQQRINKGWYKK